MDVRDGGLCAFAVGGDDCAFNINHAGKVGAEGGVDGDAFFEVAAEDGLVGFFDAAFLDGALEAAGCRGVFGEDDDAGGFAVEAEDEVRGGESRVFAHGGGEA